MSEQRIERCCLCDDPTGRVGRADDSIYVDAGKAELGPLCPECYRGLAESFANYVDVIEKKPK